MLSFNQNAGKDISASADTSADPGISNTYTFLRFTVSHGGVEQVFRPAVKLINPPALAAEVYRARIRHTLKRYREQNTANEPANVRSVSSVLISGEIWTYAACPALKPDAQAH